MPNGTAKSMVTKVNNKVPMIAGKMPPSLIPCVGNRLIKCHERLEIPFDPMSNKMIPNKRQTIKVLPNKKTQLKRCITFFMIIEIVLTDLQNIRLSY